MIFTVKSLGLQYFPQHQEIPHKPNNMKILVAALMYNKTTSSLIKEAQGVSL